MRIDTEQQIYTERSETKVLGDRAEHSGRCFFCIDMKCFYASVECAERGLNPFETCLVVADETRGKNAICLAISPKMKALGIKNRCRMSDIPGDVRFITAPPRMQLYIEYAADIYALYLDWFSPEDIHVYSIDESFIDVTSYLKMYGMKARELAAKMISEISTRLKIPSTAGIGTNLYLAKIALDITAKHSPDRIGILTEKRYIEGLWDHEPITDFWQISTGTAARLEKCGIRTMRGIAMADPALLHKLFGVNSELLIDHAYGRESCLISDIKKYKSSSKSFSASQILPHDYTREAAATVLCEMVEQGCHRLISGGYVCSKLSVTVAYSGDREQPSSGSIRIPQANNSYSILREYACRLYGSVAEDIPIRRLAISFEGLTDAGGIGYDIFTDPEKLEKERLKEETLIDIHGRFGKNALMRASSFTCDGTMRERNEMIGGHRAGFGDMPEAYAGCKKESC
ncbi:MAG: DNA repair protein [Clostridia bacterium]|nr:DNA repair protein [Clostridia bacterium]